MSIIGAGIGGMALAIACLHRGIPFTIYERDISFDSRKQGYGLTLQQASNSIKGLGISSLLHGIYSTRHIVINTNGEKIVEWGMRTREQLDKIPKRTNIHIARQSLRLAMFEQLNSDNIIKWGHQLTDIRYLESGNVELNFLVENKIIKGTTDLVVGADGIFSSVRRIALGDKNTPLQYLGFIVVLGICPLENLKNIESDLLDSATVFQTVNGNDRMYMMPYTNDAIMWQFSFPISENEAKRLSELGATNLKRETLKRTQWHTPIPEIISETDVSLISGYPVYDRELLNLDVLQNLKKITLIGDAAHPMSPFKGQGANQAILDALDLARTISRHKIEKQGWREIGLRNAFLNDFEKLMVERSSAKVIDSAKAAQLLHSNNVLRNGNGFKTRGIGF